MKSLWSRTLEPPRDTRDKINVDVFIYSDGLRSIK